MKKLKEQALLVLVLAIVAIVLSWVCSCKTIEKVERIEVHDTLRVVKTDTLMKTEKVVEWRDSVVHDSVKIWMDQEGKVVYKEVVRDRFVNVQRTDCLDLYRSRCDSLVKRSKGKEVKKEKEIVEKVDYSGWWAFSVVLLLVGIVLLLRFMVKKILY